MTFDLSDYTPAFERIRIFMKQYPQGIIQTGPPTLVPGRDDLIMVEAVVYRGPDDQRPVRAYATELTEGRTSFTRNREVENASTSALARALGYMGIGIDKGLASLDEVVNREEPRPTPVQEPKKAPRSPVSPTYPPVPDPWALEAVEPDSDPQAPICGHGPRVWKEGTSKAGKPWSAWMCSGPKDEACDPMWRT